ncbi:hypothetical protein Lalb_Chr07g0192621 [Lupinus albus]|uniref:Uncharacterized protein n=1 Tax=Lupinus albus TaxID=3870 RepID=A0A6A4QBJ5_LUPAL|nr:hypothetical protein Lalb_Chr07g0192621 [Lupinus albus]
MGKSEGVTRLPLILHKTQSLMSLLLLSSLLPLSLLFSFVSGTASAISACTGRGGSEAKDHGTKGDMAHQG